MYVFLDIIGHVVEKDDMNDKEVNGRMSKLIEITLEELAPASKKSGKRSAESVEPTNIEKKLLQGSTTKPVKLKSIKVEKK
jgi:hypothetical protein